MKGLKSAHALGMAVAFSSSKTFFTPHFLQPANLFAGFGLFKKYCPSSFISISLLPSPIRPKIPSEGFHSSNALSGNTQQRLFFFRETALFVPCQQLTAFPGLSRAAWGAAGSRREASLTPGCQPATLHDIFYIILIIPSSVTHPPPAAC